MAQPDNPASPHPEAKVRTRRRVSIVWVVPLVALGIGGWLGYKAMSEKGPTVTIDFATAEGLEAGKTKIKFKDVEVGQVKEIRLRPDLSGVSVVAEMVPGAKAYLTDKTRFWVVRAHVSAGEVTGLGTLLGGAYIGVDPNTEGTYQTHFTGLGAPPPITADRKGRHFVLRATSIGSIGVGAPIYYRRIKVGEVVSYHLDEDDNWIKIRIFIDAPHEDRVRTTTRFWDASGFDVTVDSSGVKVNTESLVSILSGGIAFDTPADERGAEAAPEDYEFRLFPDRQSSTQRVYARRDRYLLYFSEDSVRGLETGSDVLFRGVKVGEVTDVRLEYDWASKAPRIPVEIELEPERVTVVGVPEGTPRPDRYENMTHLIKLGLRAQLASGNLLTGRLVVGLDFHPNAPPQELRFEEGLPVLPTVPTEMKELTADLSQILDRVSKIPFESIGNETQGAIRTLNTGLEQARDLLANLQTQVVAPLNETLTRINQMPFDGIGEDLQTTLRTASADLEQIREVLGALDREVMPEVSALLKDTQTTLSSVRESFGARSGVQVELRRSLAEIADAARAVAKLADYLERHPEGLLRGKEGTP